MSITREDIIPLGQARARLTEISEAARNGREKIITRNGEAFVALIDARRLDHYHQLEREHIHLVLLEEAERGWDDVVSENVVSVSDLKAKYGR